VVEGFWLAVGADLEDLASGVWDTGGCGLVGGGSGVGPDIQVSQQPLEATSRNWVPTGQKSKAPKPQRPAQR
jgi:hypothetical protein